MAATNINTPLSRVVHAERAYNLAIKEVDAAYAVCQLGDLVRSSSENGGFEGIENKHWTAIGISIDILSDMLYQGTLGELLNQAEKNVKLAREENTNE